MVEQDLFVALQEKDAAIEAITQNTKPWMHFALEMLAGLPDGMVGTSEDFRAALMGRGIEEPHPNAWGALTLHATKRKLLMRTGEWRPMASPKSHGRLTPVYRLHHG